MQFCDVSIRNIRELACAFWRNEATEGPEGSDCTCFFWREQITNQLVDFGKTNPISPGT